MNKMHKPRRPQSIEAAISAALSEIDDAELKWLTGKSRSLVNKWADDECELNFIPLYQAVNLAAGLKVNGVQERFTEAFRASIARKVAELGGAPRHSPADPTDRLTSIFIEAGDVAREIQIAIDPKGRGGSSLTLCEKSDISVQVHELMDACKALLKDLEA